LFNEAAGSIEASAGVNRIITERGPSNYAVYGPYERLAPGRYEANFQVEPKDSNEHHDGVCAIVDVVSDRGAKELASDYLTLAKIGSKGGITLQFDVTETLSDCEYRVWVSGAVSLAVADPVVIRIGDFAGIAARPESDTNLPWPLKSFWEAGIPIDQRGDEIVVRADKFPALGRHILRANRDRTKLAEAVVDSVGYRGCEANSLFRAFVGTDKPIVSPPQPVPFTSSLCHQVHFGYEQYRYWIRALKEVPKYQRKQWEFVYIAQTLYEQGYLRGGNTGLVFGAGQEQLPALFASFGVKVLATDQAPENAVQGGWIESGQHTYDLAALNQRSICTERMFSELVSYRSVDMNDIPVDLGGQFDFCWSACALEHLGSLQHGLSFIENSMRTLKPGGVAIHTTEYNLSSNEDTVENVNLSIYRRRDIEAFMEHMIASGYEVSPIDWQLGEGFAEMVIDVAPYLARGEPHIRLLAEQYETTSIGLIIKKPK
jgi:SAM-dependent methyltransferase